ncbi:MAG TPA: EamA family transporter [Opitutaceae bacterium]|nr:EamA family transporter [Opitutaceae bacterium]
MIAVEKRPPPSAFLLAFAAIYLIWGSTYLGIRVAVQTIPPFLMAAARFFCAGLLLLAFLKAKKVAWPTPKQWRDNAIVGTFLLLGGNGLVAWAEQTVPSGITALVIGVQPVFMVMTEWAWPGGLRPNWAVMVGMALGFVGVAWLAAPWETGAAQPLSIAGLVGILCACGFWAFGSIYLRHAKPSAPPFMASAVQMLMGSLALAFVAAVRGEFGLVDVSRISGHSWFAFVYLILIGSLVGFSTFAWLMKHSTPARVATYAYVNPVVAVILGYLLLDEPISRRTVFGAIIIVVAVVIVTTQKTKAKALAPPGGPGADAAPARTR